MKHVFNLLVTILLFASALGVWYAQENSKIKSNYYSILFLPLIIFMLLWGFKLHDDYRNKP